MAGPETTRRSGRLAALAAGAALAAACTSGPPPVDHSPYEARIAALRAEKDAAFRAEDGSPLTPEARAGFTGLPYYAIDLALRVPAVLSAEPDGPPVVFELQTSANTLRRMRRVGVLKFSVGGVAYALSAFAPVEARTVDRLFVPFGDLTNGTETYGGGRYLDLDRTATGLYDLDFNRAYHPFCVFDIRYVCPVPPRENRLPVAIRAGERFTAGAS